ncbi:hypothetical protein ZYGR_0AS04310 [Zygosaccharomyces rouxii]|uniref:FHA domain-containing protein n=1 Tax=Zygosaccharomyces rouxii TaxID=4956 RepID=A0A1Q3AHA9_ZYGRO|nr:hypothetical protein ZYGR_0AS04310 [Zygosaccharomyces rouxii]
MWILRYQYDLEDGNLKHVSCCLRLGETYNIGRSSKNLLNIKNDKSISRQHVSVAFDSRDLQLKLVNQGKMTAVSGKYLKMGESISFEKSTETVLVELGTKPLKMQLQWMDSIWMIPQQSLSRYSSLKDLGIELFSSEMDRANLIVLDEQQDHPQWLYGLLKKIPLMNLEFLRTVFEKVSGHETEFDSIWTGIMNDGSLRCKSWDVPAQILRDLEFLNVDGDKVTMLVIEAAGGKYSAAGSTKDLQEQIKTKGNTDNVIILRNSSTPVEELASLGKTFTVQDVVEAILKDEVNSLKNGVVGAVTKRPEAEVPAEKPVTKKRRLNRPRVKPLDILSFFAGGDSMKESQEQSTIKVGTQQEESREPKESGRESKGELKDVKEFDDSPKEEARDFGKESKEVLKPEVHKELKAKPPNQEPKGLHEGSKADDTTKSLEETVEPTLSITEPEPAPAPAPETTNNAHHHRKPTLSDYRKSDTPSQNDMIQMIQDTKNSEVKRLNSTIIQVGDEELTEDAINQLGNLVLVDRNENLLRRRDHSQTVDSHNPDWNNRKNFKKFVKIWPKYGRQESASREGSSDTIRNRAFLLTRQYVPTRKYTSDDASKQVQEDLYDFREPPRPETPLEPQVEAPGPNNLFVMDEDDSQDVILEEPEKPVAPPSSHLINDRDSDSDSDDDEPKFQFKRRRR